jgi:hypothetical protein
VAPTDAAGRAQQVSAGTISGGARVSFNRHLTIDRVGRRAALLLAALFLALAPPGAGAAREGGAALLVTWETADGSTFNAVVTDPESIARIEAAFPGDGRAGIPNGTLAPGDGGVNAPTAGTWSTSSSSTSRSSSATPPRRWSTRTSTTG